MNCKSIKLEHYAFCEGNKCKKNNTTLVKIVYEDMQYVPLCLDCISKYTRQINIIKKGVNFLSDNEVSESYFKGIGLIP